MLIVREYEIAVRKFSGEAAQLRTLEVSLVQIIIYVVS